jgi:hypothetical protein
MRAAIASLLALASAVSAVGNAVVINNSLDTLYLWSVGDTTSEEMTVAPGKSHSAHPLQALLLTC